MLAAKLKLNKKQNYLSGAARKKLKVKLLQSLKQKLKQIRTKS
jgi:hypothetical protein